MTVAELIDELRRLPQDFPVKVFDAQAETPEGNVGEWDDLSSVEVMGKVQQVWIWTKWGNGR